MPWDPNRSWPFCLSSWLIANLSTSWRLHMSFFSDTCGAGRTRRAKPNFPEAKHLQTEFSESCSKFSKVVLKLSFTTWGLKGLQNGAVWVCNRFHMNYIKCVSNSCILGLFSIDILWARPNEGVRGWHYTEVGGSLLNWLESQKLFRQFCVENYHRNTPRLLLHVSSYFVKVIKLKWSL